MKNPRQSEQQRLSANGFSPYEPTTLKLQAFEQWIEEWQVKMAELAKRRIQ